MQNLEHSWRPSRSDAIIGKITKYNYRGLTILEYYKSRGKTRSLICLFARRWLYWAGLGTIRILLLISPQSWLFCLFSCSGPAPLPYREWTEQKPILYTGEKINKNLSASFSQFIVWLGGVGGYINKSINIIGHTIPVFLSLTLNLNPHNHLFLFPSV